MKALILGGARSGKSRIAEQRAVDSSLPVVYLATATAGDAEMQQRIAHHRSRRPSHWTTVEEPLHLAEALVRHASEQTCLLVDCLTLWLNNLMPLPAEEREKALTALVNLVPRLPGRLILVSNEVGQGIVPMGELSRQYVDEAGRLHQRLAAACDRVTLVVAGLELQLKGQA